MMGCKEKRQTIHMAEWSGRPFSILRWLSNAPGFPGASGSS
jgi:hypothetical protein